MNAEKDFPIRKWGGGREGRKTTTEETKIRLEMKYYNFYLGSRPHSVAAYSTQRDFPCCQPFIFFMTKISSYNNFNFVDGWRVIYSCSSVCCFIFVSPQLLRFFFPDLFFPLPFLPFSPCANKSPVGNRSLSSYQLSRLFRLIFKL